jgi:hypothetical protein
MARFTTYVLSVGFPSGSTPSFNLYFECRSQVAFRISTYIYYFASKMNRGTFEVPRFGILSKI